MGWILHVTVAAVIEKDSKFLLVKEMVENQLTYNQPAGHLEENESLSDAVIREVYEETGADFEPRAVIGVYHWQTRYNRDTYIRVAFRGRLAETRPAPIPDKKIIGSAWLSAEEIKRLPREQLRTLMVLKCIEDYRANLSYPLSILSYLDERSQQRQKNCSRKPSK